jgi:sugar phosphate permease
VIIDGITSRRNRGYFLGLLSNAESIGEIVLSAGAGVVVTHFFDGDWGSLYVFSGTIGAVMYIAIIWYDYKYKVIDMR